MATAAPAAGILLLGLLLAACQGIAPRSTPTPEGFSGPLPEFIDRILVPGPKAVVSLDDYRKGRHYPPEAHPAPAENAICAHVSLAPLLDWGESPFKLAPFSVTVDGNEVPSHEKISVILHEFIQLDDSRNVIATKSGGPLVQCWIAELEPGVHVATIEVQTTTGETLTYSWSFELVNE
jgi:hypothetical protein